MTDQTREKLLRAARGWWQRKWAKELVESGEIPHPVLHLRGYASQYASKYERSWRNFVDRARAEGLRIEHVPGPRGGYWTGRWVLREVVGEHGARSGQ